MNDEMKKPVGLSQEVRERLSEILVRKAKSIGVDETDFLEFFVDAMGFFLLAYEMFRGYPCVGITDLNREDVDESLMGGTGCLNQIVRSFIEGEIRSIEEERNEDGDGVLDLEVLVERMYDKRIFDAKLDGVIGEPLEEVLGEERARALSGASDFAQVCDVVAEVTGSRELYLAGLIRLGVRLYCFAAEKTRLQGCFLEMFGMLCLETSIKDYRRSWMEEYDYSDSDWGDDVSAEELGQMYPNEGY